MLGDFKFTKQIVQKSTIQNSAFSLQQPKILGCIHKNDYEKATINTKLGES